MEAPLNIWLMGRRLAQWIAQASHVRGFVLSDPGLNPGPGPFAVPLPLSLILFPVQVFSCSINKAKRPKKKKTFGLLNTVYIFHLQVKILVTGKMSSNTAVPTLVCKK